MPIFTLEESNYSGPIEEDSIFAAELTGVSLKTKTNNTTKEEYTRLEWVFVITEPGSAWDGVRLWGESNVAFIRHPDCRLYNWSKEILAVEDLPSGTKVDTDNLRGMACRVVVGARRYEKDGQEKIHNFVKDVFRSKNGTTYAHVDTDDEPF